MVHCVLMKSLPTGKLSRDQMEVWLDTIYESFRQTAGTDTLSKRKPWVGYLEAAEGMETEFANLFEYVSMDDGSGGTAQVHKAKDNVVENLLLKYRDWYRKAACGTATTQCELPFKISAIGGSHSKEIVQRIWRTGMLDAKVSVPAGCSVYEMLPTIIWHHLTNDELVVLGNCDNVDTSMQLGTTNWAVFKLMRQTIELFTASQATEAGLFASMQDRARPYELEEAMKMDMAVIDLETGELKAWCAEYTNFNSVLKEIRRKLTTIIKGIAMLKRQRFQMQQS